MASPTYTYRGTVFADRKGSDCKLIRITDQSAMVRFEADGAVKIVPKYCIRRKKEEVASDTKTE